MKPSTDALDIDSAGSRQPGPAARPEGESSQGIVISLFQRHASRIRHTLAFRLRNRADAEDAAQEAFLKLWRRERQGNLRDEATAYLNTAASSTATDLERWRTVHVTDRIAEDVDIEEVPASGADLEQQQHWRDAMALFVQSIEKLPKLTRDAFVLYHVKGMTYPQIAAELQVSSRTVERHIIQATYALARKLKDYL